MNFNLMSKIPIYEQVKNQIINFIDLGIYAINDRLPSVRELANSLNVNPNTVEKAYSELETLGYIYSLNKKGFYVAKDCKKMEKDEIVKNIKGYLLIAKKNNLTKKEIYDVIEEIYQEKREKQ